MASHMSHAAFANTNKRHKPCSCSFSYKFGILTDLESNYCDFYMYFALIPCLGMFYGI